MMAHWQQAHKTKTKPPELSDIKISEKEKVGLVKKGPLDPLLKAS